jgi:hypothetical protein
MSAGELVDGRDKGVGRDAWEENWWRLVVLKEHHTS